MAVIAKITGFKRSKLLGENKYLPYDKNTSFWVAPKQLWKEDEIYVVDCFNLGCLIYYVSCGANPFGDAHGIDFVENILDKNFKYKSQGIPSELLHLINGLLMDDPNKR